MADQVKHSKTLHPKHSRQKLQTANPADSAGLSKLRHPTRTQIAGTSRLHQQATLASMPEPSTTIHHLRLVKLPAQHHLLT
jgi:hypothetical protein